MKAEDRRELGLGGQHELHAVFLGAREGLFVGVDSAGAVGGFAERFDADIGDQAATVSETAGCHLPDALRELVVVVKIRRPSRGKIAILRVVRTFPVVDPRDQFRDQEIEVRIALSMRVRGHVDRHARHRR